MAQRRIHTARHQDRKSGSGPARLKRFCAAVGILFAIFGCDRTPSTVVYTPPDTSALRGIIRFYVTAASELGRPPKNMDELKSVLAPLTNEPDKYLRSTRDGEQFVVVWGLNLYQQPPDTIVAYERKGVDGKRLVLDVNAMVREVTPEEFANLKVPKGHKPES
jgi:hypothetical protein